MRKSQLLRTETALARDEDLWEKILSQELNLPAQNMEPSWAKAPQNALSDIRRAQSRAAAKRMQMAQRMTDIVEKETALAEEERRQRKDAKHKERKARRLARQGRDPALAWKPPSQPMVVTDTSHHIVNTGSVKDGAKINFDYGSNRLRAG